jgi:cytochrome c oxidase subunit 2
MQRYRRLMSIGLVFPTALAYADTPMSYLRTYGPAADPVTRLGWGLGAISLVVTLIIAVLLLVALLRPRAQATYDERGRLGVRRDEGGLSWIFVGVGVSTVVLLIATAWTLVTLSAVAAPTSPGALTLRITGNQWWWAVSYREAEPALSFNTANEIHIPVGQPVRIELSTSDVIHSFWIPQLAGKTDIIPGQTNVAWLQADQPGVYRGQCGEYCGLQHAGMALDVIADQPEAFRAWLDAQARPAAVPASGPVADGAEIFLSRCSVCHTVRGTQAGGIVGPDLTHVMSRQTLAAGLLPNDAGNLGRWIVDPQGAKPGCRMPNLGLAADEVGGLLAYVQTLK